MSDVLAIAVPGAFELLLLLGFALVPLGVLFAIVYWAVKLAKKSKGNVGPPPQL